MDQIIMLSGADLTDLIQEAAYAAECGREFRVCIEDDQVKVKSGSGMWTYGLGQLDPMCRKAQQRS